MFERNRRGLHAIAAAVLVGGIALQPAGAICGDRLGPVGHLGAYRSLTG
jgi:hypothetical protein